MSAVVMLADARNLPLPDGSADLIVTSPPYFSQRDYRDGGESVPGQIGSEETPREYIANLLDCTREWMRILKPGGSIFVNLGDKFSQRVAARPSSHQDGLFPGRPELRKDRKRDRAAGLARMPYQNVIDDEGRFVTEKSLMLLPWRYAISCADELGLIVRRDIVWHKLSMLPESVNDRCATRHEYLFHFVKQPQYYSAVDVIREPHTMRPQRRPNGHKARQALGVLPAQTHSTSQRDGLGTDGHPLGKLPGSVWEIASQPFAPPAHLAVNHYATFPFELPRRIIQGWSPPGICTKCGEGRRPVSAVAYDTQGRTTNGPQSVARRFESPGRDVRAIRETTITGWVCACAPFTQHEGASGRERDGQSYARETGRDAHPHGGVGVLPRTGPWREYHFDRWEPAPTRPALVLDPFAGSGTTLLVADVLGRDAVGVDLSADYCRLAEWRIADPGERARAMQLPKPPPVPPGQPTLFDDEDVPA